MNFQRCSLFFHQDAITEKPPNNIQKPDFTFKEANEEAPKGKIKLILTGDVGVGKTSLINSFMFGEFNEKYLPTLGVDFSTKVLKTLKAQIWDTVIF